MLGIMRKYKESILIKLVFLVIVLSFIGTIFLVWGKGDRGVSGGAGYAAKVNGTRISYEQFQKSYYNVRSIYQQIYGQSLTPELEKKLNIRQAALDAVIDQVLVQQEVKKMGISASKDEVKAAINAIPAFQVNGAFDFQQYQNMLRSNRLTPKEFEENQEMEIKTQKARKIITDKVQVSDDDVLKAYKKQNDKLQLSYVAVSPASVKSGIKLTDAELNLYLDSNKNDFKTPEQVSFSYVLIDPIAKAGKTTVTDEELQTFYQKNIDRYQDGKGGILPLSQVKDKAKVDAARAKAAKLTYETVADTVNKNLKTGDLAKVAQETGTKIQEVPLFTAATPPADLKAEPELVKRAFMLKENELGGPVETKRGIYVLKLKQRKPADVPPLNAIRAAVTAKATEQKARDLAKTKADEALAQLAKGQASGQKDTTLFGFNDKGEIPGIGASPELMEAAFSLTQAAPTPKSVFKLGETWYAVKLKARTDADLAEFQKTKEQLRQALLPKKRNEALTEWLKQLKAKAKIDTDPMLFKD